MMILPIADVLQNTLQNLVSRIAGINNEELANRGIGMAGAMAYSIKTIAYQFKGNEVYNSNNNNSFLGRMFAKDSSIQNNQISPMKTTQVETTPMKTTPMNVTQSNNEANETKNNIIQNNKISNNNNFSTGRKIYNTGKEFMNIGMYAAEGRNFKPQVEYNRRNINNSRKEDYKKRDKEESNIINNIQEQDKI